MGRGSNGGMSDHEFIRAFQIEQRECEMSHDVAWRTIIVPDDRLGVLNIRLEAFEVGIPGAFEKPLCSYQTSWPNVQVMSFTSCLFNAAVRLTRLVEDSRRDLWNSAHGR